MLNCKEISHLASQHLDKNLPFHTRMRVRVHLFMCVDCRSFMNQFKSTIAAIKRSKPASIDEQAIEHQVSILLQASKDIKPTNIDK